MDESILNKIVSPEYIESILNTSFREHNKIAFTNGCFDFLHRGHLHYLSSARKKADILIIGLNSDNSVRRLKGAGRPVNDEQSRSELLASLQFVDYVIIFEEDTPINLIKKVKPDLLVKGGDYRPEEIVGYTEVTALGGKVEIIPFLKGFSSTEIISRLQKL